MKFLTAIILLTVAVAMADKDEDDWNFFKVKNSLIHLIDIIKTVSVSSVVRRSSNSARNTRQRKKAKEGRISWPEREPWRSTTRRIKGGRWEKTSSPIW
jgi:hypothetical protein